MKHIIQKDARGCSVACLAMITDLTYEDVARDFSKDLAVEGLYMMEIDNWLALKGYAVARLTLCDHNHKKRDVWPPLPFADVHLCNVDAGGTCTHIVIMLQDGSVLDPLGGIKDLTHYKKVNSVAGVYSVTK